MECSSPIKQAIAAFKKEKGHKKAFLFHGGQVFYFYDHEFCKVDYAHLSLSCHQLMIEYELNKRMIDTLFIQVAKEVLTIATSREIISYETRNRLKIPFKLALSYGILADEATASYLRGFVYTNSKLSSRIYSSYFTESDIAALLEILFYQSESQVPLNSQDTNLAIAALTEKINHNHVKALCNLYLKGEKNGNWEELM